MEGYRIEVAENSYILFEKEEDYLKMFYLEKVLFDFFKNLSLIQDKDEDEDEDKDRELRIRLKFRLSLIEKYISSLPRFNITIFYDNGKFQNPLEIKFPNVSCFGMWCGKADNILDDISELGDESLEDKYLDFYNLMEKLIHIKYCKRKFSNKRDNFNAKFDSYSYSDTDTDTDTDTDSVSVSDSDSD